MRSVPKKLFAVLIPILGLGAFLWWTGRDMIQGTLRLHSYILCPNCGNDFQVFRSSLNDELQLCPFCSRPFSVVSDEFVRDSVKFSNQSTTFGQAFNDFSRSKKGCLHCETCRPFQGKTLLHQLSMSKQK